MNRRSLSFIAALALASAPLIASQGGAQTPPPTAPAKPAEAKAEAKLAPLTAATLAGKWTLSLETGSGSSESTLDIKADPKDAKKVTGTITSQLGEAQFQSGEVVDGKLTLSFVYAGGGNELTIAIVGTQQKDGTLAGTLSFGQGEIPWTALRSK